MAISPSLLTASGSDTDAIDYATASVSPTAGTLVLAAIQVLDLGSSLATPTCSGCGLTWTLVAESGGTANQPRLVVFRAYADPGTVTSGAITFAGVVTAGQTADGAAWMVVEVGGVNTTTNNGVVQSQVASVNTDSISATLGAFANAANGTVAFSAPYDNAGGGLDVTPGTGFTELADIGQTAGGDSLKVSFQYRTDNDTSVDATVSAANDRFLMVAMEIAAAGTEATAGSAAVTIAGNTAQTSIKPSAGSGAAALAGQDAQASVKPNAELAGIGFAGQNATVTTSQPGQANAAAASVAFAGLDATVQTSTQVARRGGRWETRRRLQLDDAAHRERLMREDEEIIAILTGVL